MVPFRQGGGRAEWVEGVEWTEWTEWTDWTEWTISMKGVAIRLGGVSLAPLGLAVHTVGAMRR